MKAVIPLRIVTTHRGEVLSRETREVELSREQINSICSLIINEIEKGGYGEMKVSA